MDEQESSYQFSQAYSWAPLDFSDILGPFEVSSSSDQKAGQATNDHEETPLQEYFFDSSPQQTGTIVQQPPPEVFQDGNSDESSQSQPKSQGEQGGGQKTRNMLQYFRIAHRQFLNRYKKKHSECQDIARNKKLHKILFQKEVSISMKDFEWLYTLPELAACWGEMLLQTRYLHRHVLEGKARLCQRLTYLKKIDCFENAFKKGKFEYIN